MWNVLELLTCLHQPKEKETIEPSKVLDDGEIPPDMYLDELLEKIEDSEKEDKPIEVVLKDVAFDVNKIKSYESEEKEVSKPDFRPQNFNEFIGQEYHKKRIMQVNLPKIRNGRRNHFFFDALPSAGKTTMARIIAKELDAKIIERIGQQLTPEDIINILMEINASKEKHVVFFVDEIETMKPEYLKFLNPILEDFEISGIKIKSFVFIGATVKKYKLMIRSGDTFSRYFTHIRFNRYTADEMNKIIKQYVCYTFPDIDMPDETINKIAMNCKYTPRIANDMVEDYEILKDIDALLKFRGIIKDGLDENDIKIIKILQNNVKPMGAKPLSMKAGLTQEDYENVYEPYLVEMDYIQRTRSGRQIDVNGIKLLEDLK